MALTIAPWAKCAFQNKFLVYTTVLGDAAETTIRVPLGRPEGAWIQNIDQTTALRISDITGNLLTYHAAPAAKYHYLFAIGFD
jgi:hypothetical protein